MFSTPSKKRAIDGDDSTGISRQNSQISLDAASSSAITSSFVPRSPFGTASVLGSSFKTISIEQNERKKLEAELKKTQYEFKMAELELEKKTIELAAAKSKVALEPDFDDEKFKEIEKERDYLFKAVQKFKDTIETLTSERDGLQEQWENLKKSENICSRETISDLSSQVNSLKHDLEMSLNHYNHEISNRDAQIIFLEVDSADKDGMIQKLIAEVNDLSDQLEDMQKKILRDSRTESEQLDAEVLRNTTFAKVSEALQLEKDNRRLHGENEALRKSLNSYLLLEEKLRDAEFKLAGQKQLEQRLASAEAELRLVKESRSSQQSEMAPLATMKNLMEKTVEITRLQSEIGEIKGHLAVKTREIERISEEAQRTDSLCKELKGKLEAKESEALTVTEQLRLARLELESLKERINLTQ